MLLKSLVISVAAAVLGPTIGIGMFFLANDDYSSSHTTSFSGEARLVTEPGHREVFKMFAPPGPWYNPTLIGVHERKIDTAAGDPVSERSSWHTVVSCAEGQALSEDGRCTAPRRPNTKRQVLR